VEAAEIAARIGTKAGAVEHLRELQAHCEKMVEILVPLQSRKPQDCRKAFEGKFPKGRAPADA
jgi:hypothetical protein